MDRAPLPSFEQFCAERLLRDSEQITHEWIEQLSSQLQIAPHRVLPHLDLLDDLPLVLQKAAEFLLVPEPEKLTSEKLVIEEMRNIGQLRHRQGWGMEEVVREFDELARLLDGAALRWVSEYPGVPDPAGVGRVFGQLNRVPLLMGQIMVGALERERNALLQQLASAEEEERLRLSRELHDQLGQLLTALQLDLKTLDRGPDAGDQTAKIEDLERLVNRIARETQRLALGLRPAALSNLGLSLALEELAEDWAERTGVECDFHSALHERERFATEVETALYRIAQECLNNVLKHAGATRVSLILEYRQAFLILILEDDGCGFDMDRTLLAPDKAKRLGLRGMRERTTWLGGHFAIESSPGSGTTVFVRIPALPADAFLPATAARAE